MPSDPTVSASGPVRGVPSDGDGVSPPGPRCGWLVAASFVFAAAALVVLPYVAGFLSILCGLRADKRGDRRGRLGVLAGVVGMCVGMAWSIYLGLRGV